MNDRNPHIIARNVILLYLSTSAPPVDPSSPSSMKAFKNHVADLWDLWFCLGLTAKLREKLNNLLDELIKCSHNYESWNKSKFGRLASMDKPTIAVVHSVSLFIVYT